MSQTRKLTIITTTGKRINVKARTGILAARKFKRENPNVEIKDIVTTKATRKARKKSFNPFEFDF